MIDDENAPTLAPYTLHVALAANTRADGKVRQEHVALLGSIEGHLLPGFFDGVDPAIAEKMKPAAWRLQSLRARAAFWRECVERMKHLSNRISDDEAKQLRRAIHARIPWVMEPERKELELLEAQQDLEAAERNFKSVQRTYATAERMIEDANQTKAMCGQRSVHEAQEVSKARERVKRLRGT